MNEQQMNNMYAEELFDSLISHLEEAHTDIQELYAYVPESAHPLLMVLDKLINARGSHDDAAYQFVETLKSLTLKP